VKQFKIPLVDKAISIYIGDEEYKKYITFTTKLGFEEPDDESTGLAAGSVIWVKDINNKNVLFHEIQHALDALFEDMGFTGESEFKAYVAGHVLSKVYEWLITLR
jgi:hypothetical protein